MELDVTEIQKIIPHRYPMLLIEIGRASCRERV